MPTARSRTHTNHIVGGVAITLPTPVAFGLVLIAGTLSASTISTSINFAVAAATAVVVVDVGSRPHWRLPPFLVGCELIHKAVAWTSDECDELIRDGRFPWEDLGARPHKTMAA